MIRRGRAEGWLKLPLSALPTWSAFNDISYRRVKIASRPGYEERGSTVIVETQPEESEDDPLITVPRAMVLSLESVHDHAKFDQDFREVLAAIDEFGRVGAMALDIFLVCVEISFNFTTIWSNLVLEFICSHQ